MQLGSMFISNCYNTLHVSDAICFHPQEHFFFFLGPVCISSGSTAAFKAYCAYQEHLKTVVTASGV
jgi:hypothetical protein